MEKFFELEKQIFDLKDKLIMLEQDLANEATLLRKKVASYDVSTGVKRFAYNGKTWVAKKSDIDWSISVFPESKTGKTSKKKVAQLYFGGFNDVRLKIALGIIK
jgi:hypothetical protein